MKILWIGMGLMGSGMAANLQKKGLSTTIWNRTPESSGTKYAKEAGCTLAPSLDDGLHDADIVFSCVTDDKVLDDLFTDQNLSKIKAGSILIDCSTVGPKAALKLAQRCQQRNLRFLDAPVTGGDVGARAGTLTFMVGSTKGDFQDVRPILEKMGKKIVHAGDVGRGQALKLVNQLLCAENLLATAEAFRAADALNLNPELVIEACSSGAGGSWQLEHLGPRIVSGDDSPGFKAAHLSKDLNLLLSELGPDIRPINGLAKIAKAFSTICGNDLNWGEKGTQILAIKWAQITQSID